jgi:hypothetical protein
MCYVGEGCRQQFLARVTEHVAQPLVDLQPTAIRSDAGDADGRVLKNRPEAGLAHA